MDKKISSHLLIILAMFFIAIALISLGWIFGRYVNSSILIEKLIDWFVKIAAIMGGFATVLTAFIALKALSTWKTQFEHSERYKAIVDLEKSYRQYIDSFYIYLDAHINSCKLKKETKLSPKNRDIALNVNDYRASWEQANDQFQKSYQWARTFLIAEDIENLEGYRYQKNEREGTSYFENTNILMQKIIQSPTTQNRETFQIYSFELMKELLALRKK
ncbi:hypothetical protein G3465_02475 [Shewanella baltica]|uniref:hypothetical protein n=1 Tax=Shewanella baltica TaxID=62322 RepID=UPI00217EF208|nr:hypothetical protein [Shewanella baltica]MCS6151789.1 hypothetical protein [Shewanella baltica]